MISSVLNVCCRLLQLLFPLHQPYLYLNRLVTKPTMWLCAKRRLSQGPADFPGSTGLRNWYYYYFLVFLFISVHTAEACTAQKPWTVTHECGHFPRVSRVNWFVCNVNVIWAATWQSQHNECAPSEDSDQPGRPLDESSLSAWRKLGSLATHWAHSEDSDQTGMRMPRLIWVFAGRILILLVLSCRGSSVFFL